MSKPFIVAALILMAATATVALAASNPLIGKWKFTGKGYVDREGHNWCGDVLEMQFTAKDQTRWSAATARAPAAKDTMTVNYLVNGAKVYVSSTQSFGSGMYWNFLTPKEIQDDTIGHCIFDKE
jgi:hypothetical protein